MANDEFPLSRDADAEVGDEDVRELERMLWELIHAAVEAAIEGGPSD